VRSYETLALCAPEAVCRSQTPCSFNHGNHFRDQWDLSLSITKVLIFPGLLVRYGSSRIVTWSSWPHAWCLAMPIKIKDLLLGQRIAPYLRSGAGTGQAPARMYHCRRRPLPQELGAVEVTRINPRMNPMFDRDRIAQPDRESRSPQAGSLFSSLQKRGRPTPQNAYRSHGFSMIELMLVVIGIIILSAIAIPSVTGLARSFRIGGDTREIAAQLNLARLRAAADYTHARVYVNLSANTYHLEVWNKASACWQTFEDSNSCTQITSPVVPLAPGDTFGFGSISTGPTAATSTPAQAPACKSGVAGPSPGSTTSNTACIEFGSRTYPVDSTNAVVASDAIYIQNAEGYQAIAVSISGQPAQYRYTGSAWVQF
jgi:Tfp pilus assembly protein FimT